jgi:hypothetical protein
MPAALQLDLPEFLGSPLFLDLVRAGDGTEGAMERQRHGHRYLSWGLWYERSQRS